jgi:hypothetical protein
MAVAEEDRTGFLGILEIQPAGERVAFNDLDDIEGCDPPHVAGKKDAVVQ